MRSRVVVSVLLLTAVLGAVLTGCSGDDAEPADGPGLPSQDALRSFFEAVASNDPGRLADVAPDVTAEGSPAASYAAYVGLSGTAAAAAGQPAGALDVEEVDGGFRACLAEDRCAEWSDLEGAEGRLTDFSVNGVRLDDALVDLTGQDPISAEGLYTVQPEYAYRLPNGYLDIAVTVTAGDVDVSPRPGTYIVSDQILDGEQGPSPETVAAGETSPIVLAFPGADDVALDGEVTFTLRLGDQGEEPVGFSLTPSG